MQKALLKACLGEFIGTFILVFVGCGTVALAVLFDTFHHISEIALIWGLGIAGAIYLVRKFSAAHFNPAVTFSQLLLKQNSLKEAGLFVLFQFLGAIIAALSLYGIFNSAIIEFESLQALVRGLPGSERSAMMFGEFYPNPGEPNLRINMTQAFLAEAIGTMVLVGMIIFLSTVSKNKSRLSNWTPLFIGLNVSVLICFIAPLTQAGFNPARDFGPRLVSYFLGWGEVVFQANGGSLIVYVVAPLVGSAAAVVGFLGLNRVFKPVHITN